MEKTLVINCSYRKNGTTAQLVDKEIDRFTELRHNVLVDFLPDVKGCYNCPNKSCSEGVDKCHLPDKNLVLNLYSMMRMVDNVVFVTPVYLNAPTPKTLAFLSRLNTYNDVAGRNMFEGKKAYITAVADISGTQQTISIMMSALTLLGFEFPSKGTREHILEWKTGKIRGANLQTKTYYLENRKGGGNA